MAETVKQGTWVEVYKIILDKDERAPQIPEDTRQVPLEMKVKGFLEQDAVMGGEAVVITPIGRKISGKLTAVNPEYTHNFGYPIPELMPIGREIREILSSRKEAP